VLVGTERVADAGRFRPGAAPDRAAKPADSRAVLTVIPLLMLFGFIALWALNQIKG